MAANRNAPGGTVCALILLLGAGAALASPPGAVRARTALKPLALQYALKPGDTRLYQVTGYFDGSFPPFAHPGAPPIHMLASLVYEEHVDKLDGAGAVVSFKVKQADLSLLEHEVATGQKIDPNTETPFPIQLQQVKQDLDTVATVLPDGTVSRVHGGSDNVIRVRIGFDLRKLFLLTMPVSFPNHAVTADSNWTAEDGLLGHQPGATSYTNRLSEIRSAPGGLDLTVTQTGIAQVNDKLDENGASTAQAKDVQSVMKGQLTLDGIARYTVKNPAGGQADPAPVWLDSDRFTVNVNLDRKITAAGVKPEVADAIEGPIQVKARFLVKRIAAANGGK